MKKTPCIIHIDQPTSFSFSVSLSRVSPINMTLKLFWTTKIDLSIPKRVTFHNYLNCQNKERKSLESVSNFCCLNFHNIYIFLPLVSSGSLSSFF